MTVSAIDLRTQYAQADADKIADLEHLANRLVASPWFRDFLAKCETLTSIDLADGRNLMQTEDAQDCLRIVMGELENWTH